MSSVEQAILFYSRNNLKSIKLKKLIENLGVEVDTVSVDSKKVRGSLLRDKNYGIKEVPSVLVIDDDGFSTVFTGHELDSWFDELVTNIQNYQQSQTQPQPISQPETPLDFTPLSGASSVQAPSQTSVKEIKKEGPSPDEIAKQMAAQREQIDEETNINKPMILER